jgi:hypothetical protein
VPTLIFEVPLTALVCFSFSRPPSLCALRFLTIFDLHLSIFWFSLTLLESILVDLLASVENKGLTEKLNPLHATLTKNIGGRGGDG